jgi:hypothetical protein
LVVKNGSKRCDWVAASIPQPVSVSVSLMYGSGMMPTNCVAAAWSRSTFVACSVSRPPYNIAQPRLYACKKAFFVDLMAHPDNRGMRQEALDRAEKLEGIDPLQSRFGDHQIEGPVSQHRAKIPFPGDLDATRARKPILRYAYDAGAILWIVIDNQKPRTLIPVTAPHIFHVPLEKLGPHHHGLGKG